MSAARAMQVSRPGGPFELVECGIPQPGPRQVRIKVQACGLCHSDSLTKKAIGRESRIRVFPGTRSPDSSMPSAPRFHAGSPGSASESVG